MEEYKEIYFTCGWLLLHYFALKMAIDDRDRFIAKHRDSKLRLGELLPVSVALKTSHTALEADCPGNSGTKQEVLFTKSTLESHSLVVKAHSVRPTDEHETLLLN